jgi:hypothetical protein
VQGSAPRKKNKKENASRSPLFNVIAASRPLAPWRRPISLRSRTAYSVALELAGNPAHVMRRDELTQDVTLYYGEVAGGQGYQALIPRGIDPESVLRLRGMRPVR